ncbi:MAG: T9SS type A sorting domain-containing protein [Candidatus Marinimicrobia bacterium]|nr:T9SS type A sorting domain-containing protein [Candidatus Neomarinimicrobiota bacterium]MCF7921777.1 T9SS type A sorting domain-containing protein [Candidatus Neomarinimicrobiota bacterium]
MKPLSTSLLIGLCILFPWSLVQTNPIALKFFSELQLDIQNPTGWTIEITPWGSTGNLDGWYFTTEYNNTAFLDSGIQFVAGAYVVVRQENLQDPLYLGQAGRVITLFDNSGYWMDELRYGDVEYSEAPTPPQGQSICLGNDWQYFWYMDSSPTFGYENDAAGAMSQIEGYVYNKDGSPLPGVTVRHDYTAYHEDSLFVLTDNSGYYSIEKLARALHFDAHLEGYLSADSSFQAWPDSTQRVDFYLTPQVGIRDEESQIPEQLVLMQNYPNPFNASTTIHFGLPATSQVSIDILRLDGSFVASVLDETLSAGSYTVNWEAGDVPSGIYFYIIRVGDLQTSRKMILLK